MCVCVCVPACDTKSGAPVSPHRAVLVLGLQCLTASAGSQLKGKIISTCRKHQRPRWKSSKRTKLPTYFIRKSQIELLKHSLEKCWEFQPRRLLGYTAPGRHALADFKILSGTSYTNHLRWAGPFCSLAQNTLKVTLKFSYLVIPE